MRDAILLDGAVKQLSAAVGAMMDKHCKPIPLKKLYPDLFGADTPMDDVAIWENFLRGGKNR